MTAAATTVRAGSPDRGVNDLIVALDAEGLGGEANADVASRSAASNDNSVYQIIPEAVIAPRRDSDDLALLMTARGGGTGTNGQSLNVGVIVDFPPLHAPHLADRLAPRALGGTNLH